MMHCQKKSERPFFLFSGSRCFVEKPAAGAESAEVPQEGGIPIDTPAAKQRKMELEKYEEHIQKKYGGQFFQMNQLEGLEKAKSEVHISSPDFSDEKFKGKQPRVIMWFHQNGGQDYSNEQSRKVYEMVKKMREKGDPVVLVMPQDKSKGWADFEDSKAFKKVIEQAEKLTGKRLSDNITFGSSSGGYKGIGRVLRTLRTAGDPRAKELYKGIRKIGLCDSLYGEEEPEEIARWALSDPSKILRSYAGTSQVESANKKMEQKLQELAEGMGKKIESDVKIAYHHPAGHNVDVPTLADYLQPPEEQLSLEPNIPERDPRAMSGSEFREAYQKVEKDPEARAKLVLGQLALGNVPADYRFFEEVEVKAKDGTTLKVNVARRGLVIGEGKDTFEIPLDGPTSRAVADMYGCTIPTEWLSDKIYEHAQEKGYVVPLFHQAQFATHSDSKMQRTEYFELQQQMIAEYLQKHEIGFEKLVGGYHKDVVHPIPGTTKTGMLEIYGGYYANGNRVQPISGGFHEATYVDYSHRTRLISQRCVIVENGKPKVVELREVLKDPSFAKKFGFQALDIDKSYSDTQPQWMKEFVAGYVKEHPAGGAALPPTPPSEEKPEAAPEPVAEGPPARGGVPVDTGAPARGHAGGFAPAGYAAPPETTPPAYQPPEPEKPGEQVEVHKASGSTLFLGDSITVNVEKSGQLNITGKKEALAEGSKTSKWLLDQINDLDKKDPQKLKSFENAVMLIGTNDIGGQGGEFSAEKIFERIESIWKILQKHNIKIYAATIPPFKGWGNYTSRFEEINEKRKSINEKIRKSGMPHRIIDLAAPKSAGGLADESDPDKLAPGVSGDFLHPNKDVLAALYQRELEAGSPAGGEIEFKKSPEFKEETATYTYPQGDNYPLTVHINRPGNFDTAKKTRIVLYGLPLGQGDTIGQAIGKKEEAGENEQFHVQNIGAQIRLLREKSPNENIVVAYVQGPENSLNAWRSKHPDSPKILASLISDVRKKINASEAEISLAGHSAGGGMQREIIEHFAEIPDAIQRLDFLDSFHFLRVTEHVPKIFKWLKASPSHKFTVISYQDNLAKLEYKGKGSSIARATELVSFLKENGVEITEEQIGGKGGYVHYRGMGGQINIIIMNNPSGAVLHTELVRRNGLLVAETGETEEFNKVSYERYVQKGRTDTTPQAPQAVAAAPKMEVKPLTDAQAKANAKWRAQLPQRYKSADSKVVGSKAQELLGELKMGETSTFEIDGKKYMAVKEYHSGDPGRPNPHPGVSVVEVPEEGGGSKVA